MCDNQDFAETEQLKAYSRVLHVHFICSVKGGKYFIARVREAYEPQPQPILVCLVFLYTTVKCARNVASSFLHKKKCP